MQPLPTKENTLRLSVSKVKCFSACQKQFYFTYILKLPRKEHDYHIFGQFVHKILEDFHQEFINGATESNSIVMGRAFKAALKEFGHRLSQEHKKEGYEIIDKYLQKLSLEPNEITSVRSVEKRFNINITDNIVFNGMIDKVRQDNDGTWIIEDYKTSKNDRYLKDDLFQLLSYAYVMYCEDPTITKVRGAYIMLRHNFKRIEKDFTIEEILKIKDQYEAYAKSIEDEKLWRPNPSRLCPYCDHYERCESGRDFINPLTKKSENSWF